MEEQRYNTGAVYVIGAPLPLTTAQYYVVCVDALSTGGDHGPRRGRERHPANQRKRSENETPVNARPWQLRAPWSPSAAGFPLGSRSRRAGAATRRPTARLNWGIGPAEIDAVVVRASTSSTA